MGFIKETSLFAANLEKDLAEKDIEYGKLVANILSPLFGEILDDCTVDGEDFSVEFRGKYLLLKQVFQKFLVVSYDFFIRTILFGNNCSREEDIKLAKEKGLLTKIPTEDLYGFFIHFNKDASYVLFRELDCSLNDVDILRTSLADRDKDLFVETFNRIKCDKSVLYFIAGTFGTIFELLNAFDKPQEIYNYLYCTIPNGIPAIIKDSAPGFKQQLESSFKSYKGDGNVDENKRQISKEEYLVLLQKALQRMDSLILLGLLSAKQMIFEMESVSELFPFEKAYVDSIVNNPELQPYFEQLPDTVENAEQNEGSIDEPAASEPTEGAGESFTLPAHFFKLPIDRSNSGEFFEVEYAVEKGGSKRFTLFINYIAAQGYIEYNNRAKQLLVYTLTGRWKPDDYKSGETITWQDYGREGKELCYIIKSIIVSDQGKKVTKYDKMHKLFTGPNWSKTVPDKDQGNNASKKFKEALHDLYPEICKL